PAPIPAPAPAAAQAPSLFDEDEGTPPPAAPRGRGRAAAAEPEERPAPAPRPTAAPKGGRTAAKPEPKPKAPKAVTTLPEAEVAERLLARVNEVVRLKDAEPAVFGDPELQAKVKSAVLDELAILEAEDLIDAGLDRDGLVERLTSSLFGLGPIAAVAADEGVEAFVVHPNGVAFERRQGKWRRAGQRLDPALLSLVARRLASGIEGRGRGGSAESFRGRHAGLPGVEVCGALGGSTLPGAMLRLERPAALPDDFDRLADAGLLSMSMATFLRMCLDGRQAIAVAGPQRAARTAVLRALVAGLPAEERVVWVADRGDGGPPESAATIVTVTPPSTGEALLEEADDGGAGLADVIQWLQPGVVVIERAEPGRDVALVRAIRNRLGGLVLSVETDRWEPAGEEPGAPGQALRPPGGAATRSGPAGGVDRRLASHVDVVVELAALMDGSSRTLRVAERAAEGGDPFALTAIFEYAVTGTTEGGEVSGEYRATRAVPRFLERRKARGKRVDLSLFQG
ncbi:MAG: hypothetical protein HY907_02610, partial [Deltaproteobacteria bacterium]|nr:hypothetical protein [Deltaproteobacteria bacterium]